jgi:hypothetical protein
MFVYWIYYIKCAVVRRIVQIPWVREYIKDLLANELHPEFGAIYQDGGPVDTAYRLGREAATRK